MRTYRIKQADGTIVKVKGHLSTGLYDVNGKEIWEDDLIEYPATDRPYSRNAKERYIKGKVKFRVSKRNDRTGIEGNGYPVNSESGFDVENIEDAGRFGCVSWSRFFRSRRLSD